MMRNKWLCRGSVFLAAAVVLGGTLCLGLSHHVTRVGEGYILSEETSPPENLDCILVLGCGLKPDGSPSHMLQDRLEEGIALYRKGWAKTLLLTGDNGTEHYNEVGAMETYALAQGVPAEDIVLDYAGFSTYDSLYRAKAIFGVQRLAVVTQTYHLYRALYIAQSLGLEGWGVSASLREYRGQELRDLREQLARSKDFFWTRMQPEPKVLGAFEGL